jgi:hypothetical protein
MWGRRWIGADGVWCGLTQIDLMNMGFYGEAQHNAAVKTLALQPNNWRASNVVSD